MRKRASSPRSRPFLNQETLGYKSGSERKKNPQVDRGPSRHGERVALVFLLQGLPLGPKLPKGENGQGANGEHRDPAQEEELGPDSRGREEAGAQAGERTLKAGAAEPCLVGLPGPGPEVPYLGATPDGAAEGSIVAGDD